MVSGPGLVERVKRYRFAAVRDRSVLGVAVMLVAGRWVVELTLPVGGAVGFSGTAVGKCRS